MYAGCNWADNVDDGPTEQSTKKQQLTKTFSQKYCVCYFIHVRFVTGHTKWKEEEEEGRRDVKKQPRQLSVARLLYEMGAQMVQCVFAIMCVQQLNPCVLQSVVHSNSTKKSAQKSSNDAMKDHKTAWNIFQKYKYAYVPAHKTGALTSRHCKQTLTLASLKII